MKNTTEKSVEEIEEEFKHTVWHSRLKEFDRTTDDEEERDHPTEMFVGWLTQTLTAERQKREEMVREERERCFAVVYNSNLPDEIRSKLLIQIGSRPPTPPTELPDTKNKI